MERSHLCGFRVVGYNFSVFPDLFSFPLVVCHHSMPFLGLIEAHAWSLDSGNLERWEAEAVPLFLRALTWDDPTWDDGARDAFAYAVCQDWDGPAHTPDQGLHYMARHMLAGGNAGDWAGWSHCRDAYLESHENMDFDRYTPGVYHSDAYSEFKSWVKCEIANVNHTSA